jgi:hypothetical protein
MFVSSIFLVAANHRLSGRLARLTLIPDSPTNLLGDRIIAS